MHRRTFLKLMLGVAAQTVLVGACAPQAAKPTEAPPTAVAAEPTAVPQPTAVPPTEAPKRGIIHLTKYDDWGGATVQNRAGKRLLVMV